MTSSFFLKTGLSRPLSRTGTHSKFSISAAKEEINNDVINKNITSRVTSPKNSNRIIRNSIIDQDSINIATQSRIQSNTRLDLCLHRSKGESRRCESTEID